MQRRHSLRAWDNVHRWSSLTCTLFLLLLCLTGLPLVFSHEIGQLTRPKVTADTVPGGVGATDLDRVIETAQRRHPRKTPLFASQERRDPRIWYVTLATSPRTPDLVQVAVDARTAAIVGEPRIGDGGVMGIIRSLHVDLFAGLKGTLFLGFMGLVFVVSLISGVVLYAPFLRGRQFGAVRMDRGARPRWLDFHNLTGIAILTWAGVVGLTGIINTGSELLLGAWHRQVLVHLPRDAARTRDPAVSRRATLESILTAARARLPDDEVAFIAFPGSSFTTEWHYGVYMRGTSALTERLVRPVFLDARSGELRGAPSMPWYLIALFLSEPLHFGDYGGIPLKVLWAGMDIILIIVLASGLYLWVAGRPRGMAARSASGSAA